VIKGLKRQVGASRGRESVREGQQLNEFRQSKQRIEKRLNQLQRDCVNVAKLLHQPGQTPSSARKKKKQGKGGVNSSSSSSNSSSTALVVNKRRPASARGGRVGGRQQQQQSASSAMPSWYPAEVVSLIQNFNLDLSANKLNSNVNVSAFLIQLNNAWRAKINAKVKTLKKSHKTQIGKYKRASHMGQSYNEVLQAAQISRLQLDLDRTRAEHLFKCNPEKKHGLLDLSLSTVENLSRQILEYEAANKKLTQENKALSTNATDIGQSLQEESAYVGHRLVAAINILSDKIWALANGYLEKTIRYHRDPDYLAKLNKSCQDFQEEVEQDIIVCKESVKRATAILLDEAQQLDESKAY
jgi:hypothetical protein